MKRYFKSHALITPLFLVMFSAICLCGISCAKQVKFNDLPEPVQVVIDFQYAVNYQGDIDGAFENYTTPEYEKANSEVMKITSQLTGKIAPVPKAKARMNPMSKQKFIGNFLETNEWVINGDTAEIYVKGTQDDKLPKCIYVKIIDGQWRIYKSTGSQVTIS